MANTLLFFLYFNLTRPPPAVPVYILFYILNVPRANGGRCTARIQPMRSSDGTFVRKFVHVIGEASAPACCAARHRRNRLGGDFFPALIANYHRSGATQFDDGEAPEDQPEAAP